MFLGSTPGGGKGRTGQEEKVNCDAAATRPQSGPPGSSGAAMTLECFSAALDWGSPCKSHQPFTECGLLLVRSGDIGQSGFLQLKVSSRKERGT